MRSPSVPRTAAALVGHSHRTRSVEEELGGVCAGNHSQVRAAHDRVQVGQRRWHVSEYIPRIVRTARLQQQHLVRRVRREPIGERAARRTAARADEIVVRRTHRYAPSSLRNVSVPGRPADLNRLGWQDTRRPQPRPPQRGGEHPSAAGSGVASIAPSTIRAAEVAACHLTHPS